VYYILCWCSGSSDHKDRLYDRTCPTPNPFHLSTRTYCLTYYFLKNTTSLVFDVFVSVYILSIYLIIIIISPRHPLFTFWSRHRHVINIGILFISSYPACGLIVLSYTYLATFVHSSLFYNTHGCICIYPYSMSQFTDT